MSTSYSTAGADALFVKTVNGTGPDAGGNVSVSGGSTPADASTTVKGIVELATTAETTTGTDTVRAVTPAGVKAAIDAIPSGGGSDPWTYLVAPADTSSGEAGAIVDIPGLTVSDLPNGLYEVRAVYVAQTAALGTGIQSGFVTPAGCTASLHFNHVNGTPGAASAVYTQSFVITNGSNNIGVTAAPSSTPHVATIMMGTLRAASMSGAFKLTIKSEITGPGSAVIAKADSYLAYRRIAD